MPRAVRATSSRIRFGVAGVLLGASGLAASLSASGCLDRPVAPIVPGRGGVSVTRLTVTETDRVDLLLMIDNSASMRDKFAELGRRMPALIKALTDPDKGPDGKPLTKAVTDLHVGVITSSLGSHGNRACLPLKGTYPNDHGYLLPRAGDDLSSLKAFTVEEPGGTTCPSLIAASALTWAYDPTEKADNHSEAGSKGMQAGVSCLVQSAWQTGCGYEAQLEAVYHFLIDPAPYKSADLVCNAAGECSGPPTITFPDPVILAQRAAFLRPSSLLAVVFLTDENDFSMRPDAELLKLLQPTNGQMAHGAAGCASVKDDLEPEGASEVADLLTTAGCRPCKSGDSDPGCTTPWASPSTLLNADGDHQNLRGFHQVQRFGFNYLWKLQRYVDGFSASQVMGSDGKLAPNPIFAGGRTKYQVVVTGILGVPKTLVNDPATGRPKAKLSEAEWEPIDAPDLAKRDPHMIESIAPRALPKFTGDRTVDPIHGGERDIGNGGSTVPGADLQYACIAPRSGAVASDPDNAADCNSVQKLLNPLCQPGTPKETQPYFKAYPTLRELRLLHQLSRQDVPTLVASICDDSYAGAVQGILDKLQEALSSQCFATVLDTDAATGAVPCQIVEVFDTAAPTGATSCAALSSGKPGYCTPGASPCRSGGADDPVLTVSEAADRLMLSVRYVDAQGIQKTRSEQAVAEADGNVYVTGADGKKHLICEMRQLAGNGGVDATTQTRCRNDATFDITAGEGGGWCYSTDDAIVGAACKSHGAVGKIRYFGDVKPRGGSDVFTVCVNR
jgi:hypothetical protein